MDALRKFASVSCVPVLSKLRVITLEGLVPDLDAVNPDAPAAVVTVSDPSVFETEIDAYVWASKFPNWSSLPLTFRRVTLKILPAHAEVLTPDRTTVETSNCVKELFQISLMAVVIPSVSQATAA